MKDAASKSQANQFKAELRPFALNFAETISNNADEMGQKVFSASTEGMTYPMGERTYSTQSGSSETTDSAA
jgi:hypothetical protein